MARDYEVSPVSDGLGLREIILGLADDLKALRSSKISANDALARAALAKQIFNGVRLYLLASKFLEGETSPTPERTKVVSQASGQDREEPSNPSDFAAGGEP